MMLLVTPNTLSAAQRRELEVIVMTTRDIKLYRRAKVILYRDAGYTVDEIQEHTEYSERSQRYWVGRDREAGTAGLCDHPRSGRPVGESRRFSGTQAVEQEIGQEITQEVQQAIEQGFEQERAQPIAQAPAQERARAIEQGSEQERAQTVEQAPEQTPEPPVSKLDVWARRTLESMSTSHPKHYLRHRAQMLLLRDNGYSAAEIAEMLGVQVKTVRQVFANYDREKLAGLYRKPGSGRVSTLHPDQWEQVADWVRKGPHALGYRFVKWTTRSLRKYIFKRFNVRFSREWIRQKLQHFMGYSWTRGKKVSADPDDEKRNRERKRFAQKMLDYLDQARKGEIILLFEDESIFTLFGEVGSSWSPVGKTQEVPSAGKKGRVVVFGAAAPQSGRTHYRIETDSINQESTLRFIKQLVRYYHKHAPGIPLVIILDKHPGHTSQGVEDFVKNQHQVTLENSPTQSPDLNPQEHIWDWLAELMMKNEFFETIGALKQAIRHFFCYIAGIKDQVIHCLGDLQKLYSAEAGVESEI